MNNSIEPLAQTDSTYITKLTLAARLKVSSRTVEKWVARQLIPCVKIGRTVRFSWPAVQSRLENSKPAIKPTMLPRTADSVLSQRLADLAKKLRKQR